MARSVDCLAEVNMEADRSRPEATRINTPT